MNFSIHFEVILGFVNINGLSDMTGYQTIMSITFIFTGYLIHSVIFTGDHLSSKSTCSEDIVYQSFDHVQHLFYDPQPSINENYLTTLDMQYNSCLSSGLCFLNIRHLKLELPLNIRYLSVFPKFNQLILLDVSLNLSIS
jgi:hypothetical protein